MLENRHNPPALKFPPAFLFGPRRPEPPKTPTLFLNYPISSFVNSTAKNLGCIAPHGCRYKCERQTHLMFSGISFVSIYILFEINKRTLNPIVIIVFSQSPPLSFLRIQLKFPQGFSRPKRRWRLAFSKMWSGTYISQCWISWNGAIPMAKEFPRLLSCSVRGWVKQFFLLHKTSFFCGASPLTFYPLFFWFTDFL